MPHRGTRAPPKKVLERSATFDCFFYILGQLTRSPTKLLRPIFDLCPRHRAVALPAGPNDEADLCVMKHFLKNRSQQLWRDVRGQRENEDFIMCRWNTAAEFLRECARVRVRAPMSKYLDFQKAGLLNNYVTPVLKLDMHVCVTLNHAWHENMEIILKLFPIQIFPTFAATVIRNTASAIEFHYSLPAWRVTSHIISRPCEVFVHLWGSHAVQLTDELFHDRK